MTVALDSFIYYDPIISHRIKTTYFFYQGDPASPKDLADVQTAVQDDIPVLIGSGVTPENMAEYSSATGLIIGSYLKQDGKWQNDIDEDRLDKVMEEARKYC